MRRERQLARLRAVFVFEMTLGGNLSGDLSDDPAFSTGNGSRDMRAGQHKPLS
jgi:hypothetical protein